MSYNKQKTDPELGQKVHEYLVKMGVETPKFQNSLDRKDKIDEIDRMNIEQAVILKQKPCNSAAQGIFISIRVFITWTMS